MSGPPPESPEVPESPASDEAQHDPGSAEAPATRGSRSRGVSARATGLILLGLVVGVGAAWLAWGRSDAGSGGGGPAGATHGETLADGIDVTNDPTLGPDDAPVTIVEFSDFECPFCARFATRTAPLLRAQYGERIRWIFVNTPLRSIHPGAYDAAIAGECVAEQGKFWEFYDAMFGGRFGTSDAELAAAAEAVGADLARFEPCYRNADPASEVAADEEEARKFYILGTPTFFVNGRRLEGAQPPEAFAAVIDSILGI